MRAHKIISLNKYVNAQSSRKIRPPMARENIITARGSMPTLACDSASVPDATQPRGPFEVSAEGAECSLNLPGVFSGFSALGALRLWQVLQVERAAESD